MNLDFGLNIAPMSESTPQEQPGLYPAKWHPDPLGRHAYRWYSGARWTDHVADGGVQSVDPFVLNDVPPVPGLSAAPQVIVTSRKTNGNAIASLVLAILWLGGLGSLFAIMLAIQADKEIKARGEDGAGLAQAGMLLGFVGVVGAVIFYYLIYQASQQTCDPYSYSC